MDILTIDFETYYAKDYGLGKMTTEEYIRNPQFQVIGVAVKVNSDEPIWFSGTKEKTKAFLDEFDWANSVAVAHNAMFDMAILNWHFDIRPKRIVDTLSMARALHTIEVGGSLAALADYYQIGQKGTEVHSALGKRRIDFDAESLARYGEYCKNDVDITRELFGILAQDFPLVEYKLIDLTIRMFTEPKLLLDGEILMSHLTSVKNSKEQFLRQFDRDHLMSNPKFADLLKSYGVTPPVKISPTTGKETYAFSKSDEGFKELLEHHSPIVQALAAARLGVKSTLEETRTERLLGIDKRGNLPIPLRYYAAHTGRWGGDDKLNMQNLPRTSALKYAICAPIGYKMIDSDSSQIEARTLAWLAGQDDLVQAFENGEDVYKQMASKIYNKEEEWVSKSERFVGKTTILGSGYGMGAAKFQAQLANFDVELGLEECKRIIDVYRKSYAKIPELWYAAGNAIDSMLKNQVTTLGRGGLLTVEGNKGIRLPNGLYLKYPNIRKVIGESGKEEVVYDTKRGKAIIPTRIYGGKLIENVCQALARIIIGNQMLMINKKYRVVMTVHDAVACLVPQDEVENAKEYVEMCMRVRPEWGMELPLNCESGHGDTYGDC